MLALAGVCFFAPTIPLTKLLVTRLEIFELVFARMLLGGFGALVFLGFRALRGRVALPPVAHLPEVGLAASGVVIGFPLLVAVALYRLPGSFGAVIAGLLPLITSVLGVVIGRERVSGWFWLPAGCGSALTIYYGMERIAFDPAILVMLAAIFTGSLGYVFGARLTQKLNRSLPETDRHAGGPLVIAWALLISLPLAILGCVLVWPAQLPRLDLPALGALAYLGFVSQPLAAKNFRTRPYSTTVPEI